MKLGAISFMTEWSIGPDELARELEERGFDSFWAGDHSHIPVDGHLGGPVDTRTGRAQPKEYSQLLEPFLVLVVAARATRSIRVGTGVCLVTERDPIATAKQVATIDHLSDGRFIFGIGGGWNELEMRNHGTDPGSRWKLMRERVQAMTQIWTRDVAAYEGELVSFSPLLSRPKPVQSPYPPILIGGGRANIGRVLAYGDGWCPGTAGLSDAEVLALLEEFRAAAAEAGRAEVPVTAFHVATVDGPEPGSPVELVPARWRILEEADVERVVVLVPPERERCLPMLDRYAALLQEVAA